MQVLFKHTFINWTWELKRRTWPLKLTQHLPQQSKQAWMIYYCTMTWTFYELWLRFKYKMSRNETMEVLNQYEMFTCAYFNLSIMLQQSTSMCTSPFIHIIWYQIWSFSHWGAHIDVLWVAKWQWSRLVFLSHLSSWSKSLCCCLYVFADFLHCLCQWSRSCKQQPWWRLGNRTRTILYTLDI